MARRVQQSDVDRPQEFGKCIMYTAALEMNPLDTEDRLKDLKDDHGIGLCDITQCYTKVCPEHIT